MTAETAAELHTIIDLIRYGTSRFNAAGLTFGHSYDNALAETINGLYKAEVIRHRGPWRSIDSVEFATAEWIDWYNHRRLHEYCGDIPPAELEDAFYAHHRAQQTAGLTV